MSEDAQPGASPETPASQDLSLARTTRLSDRVAGHLADQARLTAQGAKARRMTSTDGEPGMADFTPLRDLFSELMEEARKVRARERIAHALRQAADALDPPG
jgi:hypothetical protein